jgi:hypothetical protein
MVGSCTKELILDIYDAIADAIRTGSPYQTILDPIPVKGKLGFFDVRRR